MESDWNESIFAKMLSFLQLLYYFVIIKLSVLLHYKNRDATQGQIRGYVVPKKKNNNNNKM